MFQRKIRISGHKDYIAVDIVTKYDAGKIIATPFYITPKQPVEVLMKDFEEIQYYKTKVFMRTDGSLHYQSEDGVSDELPIENLAEIWIRFPDFPEY